MGAPIQEPRRVVHGGFGAAAPLQPLRGPVCAHRVPLRAQLAVTAPLKVTHGGDTLAVSASPGVWETCSSPHQEVCTSGIM